MSLIIGLTFDLKPKRKSSELPADFFAEHDSEETVFLLEHALMKAGNKILRIGSAGKLLDILPRLKCDIVFNIAEGVSGRNRESEVPIILETAGIPYVGSDALTLSISLDKIVSKKIFSFHKIPAPGYFECAAKEKIIIPNGLNFPLIVKPRYEGSAKGIYPGSKVNFASELKKRARWLIDFYNQPAIAEEFIEGWEFTVGIIGNKRLFILPVVQRYVELETNLSSHIFEKVNPVGEARSLTGRSSVGIKPPLRHKELLEIDSYVESEIKRLAVEAYRGLECRDFARMDFRIKEPYFPRRPKIYLLEVNPLPSLAKDDYFAMTAELLNISYGDMINRILESALERRR